MPSILAPAKDICDERLNAQSSWILICSRHPQRNTGTEFGDCCRKWEELGVKSRRDFRVAERLLLYVGSTEGTNHLTRVRYLNHEIS